MLKINEGNIKMLVEWFNGLNYVKQQDIIDFINDNTDGFYEINDDDEKLFDQLVNDVKNLVIQEMDDENKIVSKLLEYGFEKIPANSLYNFCSLVAGPYVDAQVINSMSPEKLNSIMVFIINNVILYENYKSIPFKVFTEESGFDDSDKAQRVLRFTKNIIYDVCNRDISPLLLEQKVLNDYNITKSLCDVIIGNINSSLKEMQQAYLLTKINQLLSKLSNLSCTTDN